MSRASAPRPPKSGDSPAGVSKVTVAARRRSKIPKVGFVSLGCPKALVDSERILTQLRAEGYEDVRATDLTLGVASIVHGRVRSGGASAASPASFPGPREVS